MLRDAGIVVRCHGMRTLSGMARIFFVSSLFLRMQREGRSDERPSLCCLRSASP